MRPTAPSLNDRTRRSTDALALIAFCGFLFILGLQIVGLVGADEPRYAQVAREMLARHDWVTPVLYGHPWLEKPPLYYWCAMVAYKAAGEVSDTAARLPSALLSSLLIVFIFVWTRRFRRGMQLDAALITASSALIIGFGRSASTDMPLAVMFTAAMLCWYGWYASSNRGWLLGFYFFSGLATLAKGPVAVFLAGLIIVIFAVLRRDGRLLLRTLWPIGSCALPGYHRCPGLSQCSTRIPSSSASSSCSITWSASRLISITIRSLSGFTCRWRCWRWCRGRCLSSKRWSMRFATGASRCSSRRAGRLPNLSDLVAAAADRVLLVLAIEAAGLHSAGNSCRNHSAGRLHPPARSRSRSSPALWMIVLHAVLSCGGAGSCADRAVQAAEAASAAQRDHRGRRAGDHYHSYALVHASEPGLPGAALRYPGSGGDCLCADPARAPLPSSTFCNRSVR